MIRTTIAAGLCLAVASLGIPGTAAGLQSQAPADAGAVPNGGLSAASTVKYYFLPQGADYVGGGYALKVKYAGSKIYVNYPAADSCVTARKVATNVWKFRQPNASEEAGTTVAYVRTNSARTWVVMDDQYGGKYKQTTSAKARAWANAWRTVMPDFSWSDPPC